MASERDVGFGWVLVTEDDGACRMARHATSGFWVEGRDFGLVVSRDGYGVVAIPAEAVRALLAAHDEWRARSTEPAPKSAPVQSDGGPEGENGGHPWE
jgi:hypothetical protein